MGSSVYSLRLLALRSPIVRLVRFGLMIRLHVVFVGWLVVFVDKSLVTTSDVGQTTGLLLVNSGCCVAGIVVVAADDADGSDDSLELDATTVD